MQKCVLKWNEKARNKQSGKLETRITQWDGAQGEGCKKKIKPLRVYEQNRTKK